MKRSARVLGCGMALLLAAGAGRTASGEAQAEAAPARTEAGQRREPAAMSVADIDACMRANVVDRGSAREIELVSEDREGNAHKVRMKLFWKPAQEGAPPRTMLRVVEPADVAGASYLAIARPEGDEVYFYMPALGRVQRVTSEQDGSLFGTDLSYAEVKQIQALAGAAKTRRLPDQKLSERPVFVLETTGDARTSSYSRIRSYVDQATCTLLQAEFFSGGNEPRKVLEAQLSTLVHVEPWWLILGYTMEDRRSGTSTELNLSDVFLRESPPEALFDPARFHQAQP